MKIEIEVQFDPDEVKELCKQEYIKKVGPVPAGHHLVCFDYYGRMKVRTEEDEVAVAPEPQAEQANVAA